MSITESSELEETYKTIKSNHRLPLEALNH